MSSNERIHVNTRSETEAALMRVHIHLRGGMPGGQEQANAVRIAALYDAILLGMREYIARHEQCASFIEDSNPWDPASLYHALVRAGVFHDPQTFNRFSLLVERALWQGSFATDVEPVLAEVEGMLARLEVAPFREANEVLQTLTLKK